MSSDTLYDHPDFYDLVMGTNPVAEAFYIEEAQRRGGNVLALACGTGRYAVPMARAGLKVSGVDLSHSMLERARAKAASEGVHLELLQLDMKELLLGRSPI